MSDLIDRPLTMPPFPSHGTPPGSTVDLGDDDREHDLDRLVATTSQLLVGRDNLNDRDIKDAVALADRVIHFCRLHTYWPYTPPVVLSDIEGD
jgi:hypothetical protein